MALTLETEDFDFAWKSTVNFIADLYKAGLIKRNAGHLAVVQADLISPDRGEDLRNAVIWERSVSVGWENGVTWDTNARTKAFMSARDGHTTRTIIARGGSLQIGDFNWPGGMYGHGLGYGFSAVEPEGDELITQHFRNMAEFHARQRQEKETPQRRRFDEDGYIGGKPHQSLVYVTPTD